MAIHIRLELRFDVGEHQFPDGKVYRDVVLLPDRPLSADGAVRTTANQKPFLLDSSHHIHGQDARRVTDLQGTVDIKTDQDHQVGFSPSNGFAVRAVKRKRSSKPRGDLIIHSEFSQARHPTR